MKEMTLRNSLKIMALCGVLSLTGCQLSPGQRYGGASIAYSSTVNTLVSNGHLLSNEDILDIDPAVSLGRDYLDNAFEILTDGDPSNDNEALILLKTLEDQTLPVLEAAAKELNDG
jgi:hypothetical protein